MSDKKHTATSLYEEDVKKQKTVREWLEFEERCNDDRFRGHLLHWAEERRTNAKRPRPQYNAPVTGAALSGIGS